MRNPELDSPLLTRVLHFTGAVTLSVATYYGITVLRVWPYNVSLELAQAGGIGLASLIQFWMGEMLQYFERIAGMRKEFAENNGRSDSSRVANES